MSDVSSYLKEKIEVQCGRVRSQRYGETFHFSVYIFRYTEYYNDEHFDVRLVVHHFRGHVDGRPYMRGGHLGSGREDSR